MKTSLLILALLAAPVFAQEASEPIAPQGLTEQPAMYFGFDMCGKKTVWVLTVEGHFFRFDDEHKPDDVSAFFKALEHVKGDIKTYPCPTSV